MQTGLNKEAKSDVSIDDTFNSVHVIWDHKSHWFQYSNPAEGQWSLRHFNAMHRTWIFWKLMLTAEAAWQIGLSQLQSTETLPETWVEAGTCSVCLLKDGVCAVLTEGMLMRPWTSLFPAYLSMTSMKHLSRKKYLYKFWKFTDF